MQLYLPTSTWCLLRIPRYKYPPYLRIFLQNLEKESNRQPSALQLRKVVKSWGGGRHHSWVGTCQGPNKLTKKQTNMGIQSLRWIAKIDGCCRWRCDRIYKLLSWQNHDTPEEVDLMRFVAVQGMEGGRKQLYSGMCSQGQRSVFGPQKIVNSCWDARTSPKAVSEVCPCLVSPKKVKPCLRNHPLALACLLHLECCAPTWAKKVATLAGCCRWNRGRPLEKGNIISDFTLQRTRNPRFISEMACGIPWTSHNSPSSFKPMGFPVSRTSQVHQFLELAREPLHWGRSYVVSYRKSFWVRCQGSQMVFCTCIGYDTLNLGNLCPKSVTSVVSKWITWIHVYI